MAIMDDHLEKKLDRIVDSPISEVLHKLSLALPCFMVEIEVFDKLLMRSCYYP